MKKILGLLLTITCFNAFALEHKVMKITNDNDSEIVTFVVETDEQNNELQVMIKKIYNSKMQYIDERTYDADSVLSRGAVLSESDGREVVKLKLAKSFSLTKGGVVYLDYLVNGITGSREEFKFSLLKVGSTWKATQGGSTIKHLFFKSNKKAIIGTVGIKEIQIK